MCLNDFRHSEPRGPLRRSVGEGNPKRPAVRPPVAVAAGRPVAATPGPPRTPMTDKPPPGRREGARTAAVPPGGAGRGGSRARSAHRGLRQCRRGDATGEGGGRLDSLWGARPDRGLRFHRGGLRLPRRGPMGVGLGGRDVHAQDATGDALDKPWTHEAAVRLPGRRPGDRGMHDGDALRARWRETLRVSAGDPLPSVRASGKPSPAIPPLPQLTPGEARLAAPRHPSYSVGSHSRSRSNRPASPSSRRESAAIRSYTKRTSSPAVP